MMSRKNFKAIAAILAGDYATSTPTQRQKVYVLTLSLADYFQKENPRFDRARFYDAVGIGKPDHSQCLALGVCFCPSDSR